LQKNTKMIEAPNALSRQRWLRRRRQLEALRLQQLSRFARKRGYDSTLDYFLPAINLTLKWSGVLGRGKANAMNIVLREYELSYPHLPPAFDGYTLLHLTDLHLDSLPGIEKVICEKIQPLSPDLCVMTGDYRWKSRGSYSDKVLQPLQEIVRSSSAADGVYATLGNHDTHEVLEPLENMGVQVLNNDSVHIHRSQHRMLLSGTDDPHQYYSDEAVEALSAESGDFKIALIHSPELYAEAARCGYDLYLCGHTHAGQICLPGGRPLITHLKKGKKLYHGLWQEGNMIGYTSAGCGVSGIPVRYYSRGEITIFRLVASK
jgi:predicted MPP superfamily phosphohydrolase